ncbi:MAG: AAA family ATPase [Caldilineaceae bacterium]|nr:AAA family ATPase [Caldilineaceae bacterium]
MRLPTMEVRLFGDFSLRYNGDLVTTVQKPRLQSLLAYLLLHRYEPQSRQQLSFLFWPDSTEAQARTNLRKLYHQLRQALPAADQFLVGDTHYLQWQLNTPYALDVAAFEVAVAAAAKTTAVTEQRQLLATTTDLYKGQLLLSCYEDWIIPFREKYHQAFMQAVTTLVDLLEAEREYAAAIRYVQQLLHFEPLQEVGYRMLMRLHAANGERSLALKAYHTCATVLERELGIRPTAATQAAYAALLKLDVNPLNPPVVETDAAQMVGRITEWQRLQATWRIAIQGRLQVVLISGEAGIGKSRLAAEMGKWARRQGLLTATAHTYAGSDEIVYTPLVDWLRSDAFQRILTTVDDVWLSELARLLPELLLAKPALPQPGLLTEHWQRRRFFDALAQVVAGNGPPRLLILDDLQWCDGETIAWLQYLCHANRHAPLLLIATMRTVAAINNNALTEFLSTLGVGEQLVELPLPPLSKHETSALAQQTIGRPLAADRVEQLFRETEGNPLFIVEMAQLNTMSVTDAISVDFAQGQLPPRIQIVVQQRLHALSTSARNLAELAATIGRSFTVPILMAASSLDEEDLIRALDELWRQRIVEERTADAYDFTHDKLREVAYNALSLTRRRLYHRKIARSLETIYSHSEQHAVQIARHYEMAGMTKEAVRYYQRAAADAQRIYAHQSAIFLL